MDTDIEEDETLKQLLSINQELLRLYRKRLTSLGRTEAQIEAKMAPLEARWEKVKAMLDGINTAASGECASE
ncbi:hypothetical protein CEB3_c05900 [Peptococcaceae bacterium CEB3]|nr:hypothetical protein CEB3_c05900 [Peptococcaceae bacterium CEB3]